MSLRDPYLQADGQTLRNTCGVSNDPEGLDNALTMHSADRLAELRDGEADIPQTFDAPHLRALHKHIFQDVFEWAGSFRSDSPVIEGRVAPPMTNMRKAGSAVAFTQGDRIETELERLSRRLSKDNHLKGLTRTQFAKKSAGVLADLNTAHPFREGNGRVQREFMSQLAVQAGHSLDFSAVSHERMYSASEHATGGDRKPMERMMDEISDPVRCAKIRKLTGFFDKQGVDWHPHYLATTEPGQKYRGKFGGGAGEDFFMREGDRITIGNFTDVPPGTKSGDDVVITATPMGNQTSSEDRDPAKEDRCKKQSTKDHQI